MSMDEMLMNELYGSEEIQQEEQIKQAQVELVEAVAAEAGVDLNELDDEELAKFAHYVLSDEDEDANDGYYDNDAVKVAALQEADLMGRQMAHSYVDELNTITQGDNMYNNTFNKIASALSDVAEAWDMEQSSNLIQEAQEKTASVSDMLAYELEKIASDTGGSDAVDPSMYEKMKGKLSQGYDYAKAQAGRGYDYAKANKLKVGGTAAGITALGAGGAYLYKKRKKAQQEKKASLFIDAGYEALAAIEMCTPEEFAKEAEFRAAEILAANGIHPETFEDIHPEEVKLASFPGIEYAADEYEAAALEEYNEMLDAAALHIIENLID